MSIQRADAELLTLLERDESCELEVDLANQTLRLPTGREVVFPIDSFSKKCLLAGVDQLGYLRRQKGLIEAYEAAHPSRVNTG